MARKPAAGKRSRTPSVRATRRSTAPAAAGPVTVRHYCQGIGDCHLLRFPKAEGGDFWMLIDCGVHSSVKGGNDTDGGNRRRHRRTDRPARRGGRHP